MNISCIVMAPTRELAHQINKSFRLLSQCFRKPAIRIGCFFGGINIDEHRRILTTEGSIPHIVIGTPGRLRHLVQ